jgi:hypothetical protein
MYELLERLILQRIQPLIEAATPVHQAGFRKHRSCTEQVMAFTTHIVFLMSTKDWSDLSAAYDIVWRDRLMLKFMRTVPCAKISNLLNNMLSNRFFQVFLGNQSSRWRRLNNGLPQGSVLAPILFNLYMSDLPSSSLNLFQYANDIKLRNLKNVKSILKKALKLWVDSFISGVYSQIHQKLKSVPPSWIFMLGIIFFYFFQLKSLRKCKYVFI